MMEEGEEGLTKQLLGSMNWYGHFGEQFVST